MKMGGSSSPLIYRSPRFRDRFSPSYYRNVDNIACCVYSVRKDCLWTSNGYRDQTKDFDIPASQKDWTKYPDSSWAGVLVDATNRVGCYYVVNIAAKTGKTWYVEISNNIR